MMSGKGSQEIGPFYGPIKTEAEYKDALREMDLLWGAPAGSVRARKLDRLVDIVVEYEEERFASAPVPPCEILLEHMHLTQRSLVDLSTITGSMTEAIDILVGRRVIGQRLAALLGREWSIAPESLLISTPDDGI